MSRNLQILQLEQKIERLQAQLDYLRKIEEIKERQNSTLNVDDSKESLDN